MNGISEIAARPDLLDRALIVRLPSIPAHRRRDEAYLDAKYQAARPRLFGALLDAVSAALRNIDSICLDSAPRMADFAKWVVAAEESLPWARGMFMSAYLTNRQGANQDALENSPIAALIQQLPSPWTGTANGNPC